MKPTRPRAPARIRLSVSLCVLATVLAAAPNATAMGIRYDRTRLARSPDGASTLYEVRGWGPEGGGSLAYRLESKGRGKTVDFLVSSTFSPGGPTKPETVAPAACEQRLAALADEAAKRGILGVTIHPERCRASERAQLVTVQSPSRSSPSKNR